MGSSGFAVDPISRALREQVISSRVVKEGKQSQQSRIGFVF